MSRFLLPCSPTLLREDRFDLVGSEDLQVPFWEILTAILAKFGNAVIDVSSLIDVLETIKVCLRGATSRDYRTADTDYEFLREFMSSHLGDSPGKSYFFFTKTWPLIVRLALEMPELFSQDSLPCLSLEAENATAVFSRRQIACLVVHQFLCSLPPHPWDTQSFVDLGIWYSSAAASSHRAAMHAYLTALFTYFDRLATSDGDSGLLNFGVEDWPIIFTLKTIDEDVTHVTNALKNCNLCTLNLVRLPESKTSPEFLGLENGACVIAANKSVGLGPSATQEELQVGSTPESYPASLLIQPLNDRQVLVCQGAEAMVSIRGYGTEAWVEEVLVPDYIGPKQQTAADATSENTAVSPIFSKWQRRTMLFMDALPFDFDDVGGGTKTILPDLLPGRLSRELVKAYNAFASRPLMRSVLPGPPSDSEQVPTMNYATIATGLWGCGAFGGNSQIKSTLQWCAASLAEIPVLQFICSSEEQHLFAADFEYFADRLSRFNKAPSAGDVFDTLLELEREMASNGHIGIERDEIFDYCLQSLAENSRS